MPRAKLTDAEIAEFRERAVVAAETLFAEGSADEITMRAVATSLGVSPMTPYRYFESLEELLIEVRTMAFARLAEHLEAAVGSASSMNALMLVRAGYIAFALDEPHSYRLMFSVRPPKNSTKALGDVSTRSFAPLLGAVREAIEDGSLRGDESTLAHLLWAELHGLVCLHFSQKLNFGRDLDSLAKTSLVLIQHSL